MISFSSTFIFIHFKFFFIVPLPLRYDDYNVVEIHFSSKYLCDVCDKKVMGSVFRINILFDIFDIWWWSCNTTNSFVNFVKSTQNHLWILMLKKISVCTKNYWTQNTGRHFLWHKIGNWSFYKSLLKLVKMQKIYTTKQSFYWTFKLNSCSHFFIFIPNFGNKMLKIIKIYP